MCNEIKCAIQSTGGFNKYYINRDCKRNVQTGCTRVCTHSSNADGENNGCFFTVY